MKKKESPKDILMTTQDLMDYLRIKRGTLRKLMKRRAFPFIKLDRKVLFRKGDIDKFLESKIVR